MVDDKLLETILRPQTLSCLTELQWDELIHSSHRIGLLGRIEFALAEAGLLNDVPEQARKHLESARIVVENERRIMLWEIDRIKRALRNVRVPIVLLKGAAYSILGLPIANGRISSDIDLLVNKSDLAKTEGALIEHGWEHVKLDEYDQFYYRMWTHELPPLRHRERRTVVDVHHSILPPTGRLHPDPEKLMARAIPAGNSPFRALCPQDMLLHSAAHALQDGDLRRGLRDLIDLDGLLRHFGVDASFWTTLVERSEELDLARPLYYALRYANLALGTAVPKPVMERANVHAPPWAARRVMDHLILSAISCDAKKWRKISYRLSMRALYIRSHWLRMPPLLLARHLAHQLRRP